jgi:hypothetical protein
MVRSTRSIEAYIPYSKASLRLNTWCAKAMVMMMRPLIRA